MYSIMYIRSISDVDISKLVFNMYLTMNTWFKVITISYRYCCVTAIFISYYIIISFIFSLLCAHNMCIIIHLN